MLLFDIGETEAQEWGIVQRVVQSSVEGEPGAWEAMARCPYIEVYTDGSAPVRNPGGPAGFAAVLVGFTERVSKSIPERPPPHARLDLGGYVPQRKTLPLTSNNRAEMAGIMAAQEALRHLSLMAWSSHQVTIWSDSKYAVMCAKGVWKRKKNTDLWPIYDRLAAEVWRALPGGGISLEWVKGHAGNLYNEAADHLATEAAFDFDKDRYARFRAAQAATGREMPGDSALSSVETEEDDASDPPKVSPDPQSPTPNTWLNGADYALVLHTRMDAKQQSAGTGVGTGTYRIWAKDGRSRQAEVRHSGQMLHDEAEYMTLIAAMSGMAERIIARGRDLHDFTLIVYSGRELVVKQLRGEYKVKAPALQAPYAEARLLLKRFGRVDLIWKRGPELTALLTEAPT